MALHRVDWDVSKVVHTSNVTGFPCQEARCVSKEGAGKIEKTALSTYTASRQPVQIGHMISAVFTLVYCNDVSTTVSDRGGELSGIQRIPCRLVGADSL